VVDTRVVVIASAAYLGLLFAIASYGDRRAGQGRSIISSGVVYTLSLAVYATSWTYYGSVGRAATGGVGFLPIYLGPTVAMAVWWLVVRRIVRICKRNRITSLSDFIAARYGSSAGLGALVTVVAVVGIIPYIALQLKAISSTVSVMRRPDDPAALVSESVPLLQDTALYVALLLAAFTILFGTRTLDASERHEGMVAAIAFESVVKLVAISAAGGYVVYGLFDGFDDVFSRAAADPDFAQLLDFSQVGSIGSWTWLVLLSMLAILLLPRQWQVSVVENVDEGHLRTASWLFPLYLLLANVFVLPIALAGLLTFGRNGTDPDTYVLALPLANDQPALALLVFLGGLSAATGMVIVETIALSTMVSNSLVLPLLLRRGGPLASRSSLGGVVLAIRRTTIVAILLLGFVYFRTAGETRALVSIGLVSFAAVAQFAPALLGGLFWRGATRRGATAGLAGGFAVWTYTLLLPYVAQSTGLPDRFVEDGPFSLGMLAPRALFGLDGLDEISHAMTWSMLVNLGLFVGVSLVGRRDPGELASAAAFVDVLTVPVDAAALLHGGTTSTASLQALLERFLGSDRAREEMAVHAARPGFPPTQAPADADLVRHVEALLAGAVGSTSARLMVAAVVDEAPLGVPQVMEILDETSQVLATSRELARKSQELEAATTELRAANERLQELDRLKDDFVSTVTHELRTPLTSIRAFSEILLDNPELDVEERAGFLQTVVAETERLTRLINQVLDLSKLESGLADWHVEPVDVVEVVQASVASVSQLLRDRGVEIAVEVPERSVVVRADRDRVVQVLINLLSNAAKFADADRGHVTVRLDVQDDWVHTAVEDDGPGLSAQEQEVVFEKFRQGGGRDRPAGTGLGLPISREIVQRLGGALTVRSAPGEGAEFAFTLPLADAPAAVTAAPAAAGLVDAARVGGEQQRPGQEDR
jgi:Na+/proline symporter/signal transduction histidine kinase